MCPTHQTCSAKLFDDNVHISKTNNESLIYCSLRHIVSNQELNPGFTAFIWKYSLWAQKHVKPRFLYHIISVKLQQWKRESAYEEKTIAIFVSHFILNKFSMGKPPVPTFWNSEIRVSTSLEIMKHRETGGTSMNYWKLVPTKIVFLYLNLTQLL